MCDTDSDSDFEQVSSQKVPETHDNVPDYIDYKIKVIGKSGGISIICLSCLFS